MTTTFSAFYLFFSLLISSNRSISLSLANLLHHTAAQTIIYVKFTIGKSVRIAKEDEFFFFIFYTFLSLSCNVATFFLYLLFRFACSMSAHVVVGNRVAYISNIFLWQMHFYFSGTHTHLRNVFALHTNTYMWQKYSYTLVWMLVQSSSKYSNESSLEAYEK